jgi:hypothetical protein
MENLNNTKLSLGTAAKVTTLGRALRVCCTALPLLASIHQAHAGGNKIIRPEDVLREEKQLEASIHAEAIMAGPSRADEARIMTVMAERKAKEQRDLAEYAKFQFEQRLELAQASAPRINIYNGGGGLSGGGEQSGMMEGQAPVMSGNVHRGGKFAAMAQQYADKYYVRQVLDQSAQQMSADASQRLQEGNAATAANAPYGSPVEGKPGMVTSPASPDAGYIDVRGYAPGSNVIDPYSGQMMKVP